MSDSAEDIKNEMRQPRAEEPISPVFIEQGLSTGCTLLNLACTENPFVGIPKGVYCLFVGDSDTGKTVWAWTFFAEACKNGYFDNYELIYDDPENSEGLQQSDLFGSVVKSRVRPPKGTKAQPTHSETVEQFYYNVDTAVKKGKPFVYILDSENALDCEEDREVFEKQKLAFEKNKEGPGSFYTARPRIHSRNLKRIRHELKRTGSILIIISQTRDKIAEPGQRVMPGQDKKTRSGGHALKFYCKLEIWTTAAGAIKKRILGKDREQGSHIVAAVKKNHIIGKKRKVITDIFWSYGIDDIGTMIDYLLEEGHWKANTTGKISATELGLEGTRAQLIISVEQDGLQETLQQTAAQVWMEIEEACKLNRVPKYE